MDKLLLMWFNTVLAKADPTVAKVANFSKDVEDGERYAVLMDHIWPGSINKSKLLKQIMSEKRAQTLVKAATALGLFGSAGGGPLWLAGGRRTGIEAAHDRKGSNGGLFRAS